MGDTPGCFANDLKSNSINYDIIGPSDKALPIGTSFGGSCKSGYKKVGDKIKATCSLVGSYGVWKEEALCVEYSKCSNGSLAYPNATFPAKINNPTETTTENQTQEGTCNSGYHNSNSNKK